MNLQKYNQWILAIAGTVALVFLIGVLLFSTIEFFSYRYFDDDDDYVEPISEEATNELLKDSLRSQIISLDRMELIDSANKIYMLPVAQANLEHEERAEGLRGLTNSYSKIGYEKSYNTYNNLVIYNGITGESKVLFKQKVGVQIENIIEWNGQKYLFTFVTEKDTNGDKILNSNDLQSFYVYALQTGILQKITMDKAMIIMGLEHDIKTNLVKVRYGVDRNGNGEFEHEPTSYKIFDMETMTFKGIISPVQIKELQELLEGK